MILSLCGFVLATLTTVHSLEVAKKGLEADSYCNISAFLNCDLVQASSYSKFLGVPVGAWGLLYYFWLAIVLLWALSKGEEGHPWMGLGWITSLAALLYSAYMAWVSIYILEALCIECAGMYLVNFLLFLGLAWGCRPFHFTEIWKKSLPPFLLGVALFGIGGLIFSQKSEGQQISREDLKMVIGLHFRQSQYDLTIPEGRPFWGAKDAKVVVADFSDFQCSYCAVAANLVKPALHEFHRNLKFYYLNYPIDASCNPSIPQGGHAHSCFASKAGICAHQKGDFWGFHDELFKNQKQISPEWIQALVEKRGWDWNVFQSCIDSPETKKILDEDIALARKINIGGTPSIFINARRVKHWTFTEILQTIVREELKR